MSHPDALPGAPAAPLADLRAVLLAALLALLALGFGLKALGAYSERRAVIQAAETGRYLEEFAHDPVAGAWRRLSEAWQAELSRQHTLLQRFGTQALPGALRHYHDFVLDAVDHYDMAPDIDLVLHYFKRLAMCIRIGSCERDLAAARLGDLIWQFRNQHYYYLADARPGEDFDRHFETIAPRQGAARDG